MDVRVQAEKAEQFRKLHHGPQMLVLATAWDVVSARILEVVARIAHAVHVPVTADLEAGYGTTVKDMAETVKAAIDAGAIGMNLEEVTGDDESSLVDLSLQAEK